MAHLGPKQPLCNNRLRSATFPLLRLSRLLTLRGRHSYLIIKYSNTSSSQTPSPSGLTLFRSPSATRKFSLPSMGGRGRKKLLRYPSWYLEAFFNDLTSLVFPMNSAGLLISTDMSNGNISPYTVVHPLPPGPVQQHLPGLGSLVAVFPAPQHAGELAVSLVKSVQ